MQKRIITNKRRLKLKIASDEQNTQGYKELKNVTKESCLTERKRIRKRSKRNHLCFQGLSISGLSPLLSRISSLSHKKRESSTSSKSSSSPRANNTLSSSGLSKAALCTISLLSENKVPESVISYRIIKPVMPLPVTSGATPYFRGKDVTDFLKTWDNFAED